MFAQAIQCLLIAFVAVPIVAQRNPCPFPWETPNTGGAAWTTTDADGQPCDPKLRAAACSTGVNAYCYFSIYPVGYRCCQDVTVSADTTVLTTSGLEKPRCPSGSKPFTEAATGSSVMRHQVITCNLSNPKNQGCPVNYKCTKAANIPTSTTGAARNPYLCCQTTTLTSFAQTFSSSGLTPTIVPVAPNSAIEWITYGTKAPIYMGDDYSLIKTEFADADTPKIQLTTYTPSTTKFYHLLIFDATTNKDILLFQTDITGTDVVPATKQITASGTGTTAHNIKPVPTSTELSGYLYTNGGGYYSPGAVTDPPPYPTAHRYVALLFETTAALVAGSPDLADDGVLDPNSPGTFTTVTAFLKSSSRTPLGTLVAGTYYYM